MTKARPTRTRPSRARVISAAGVAPVAADGSKSWFAAAEARLEGVHGQTALLRAVIDNLPIAIYTKDRGGRYQLNNATNLRLLGAGGESDVGGKTAQDFFAREIADAFTADDRQVMESGVATYDREEPFIDPKTGEQRWFKTTRLPLRDAIGRVTGLLGISRDVTDAKLLEQQLVQSQKMETLGRLASGVAHDFNNLLTVIVCAVELMRIDPDTVAEQLENVLLAATNGAHLTRQLLTFSRRQVTEARVLDVNALIAEAKGMLVRLIRENIELRTRAEPDLWRVCIDPGQFVQVLVNLVVNARDAMPAGGRITIATENSTFARADLSQHPSAEPGDYVMVSVADTGVGVTPAVRAHLFEAFFTTKEIGCGTGLGLFTSYSIVRQCGGFITVDSTPGAGATFRVFLPRATEPVETPAVTLEAANGLVQEIHEVLGTA